MSNPTMAAIKLLRQRLEQIGTELGLDMQGFMIIPADGEDSPDLAQAMFVVRSEAIKSEKDADELLMDEQFKAMTAQFDKGGAEEDLDEIKKDLGDWLGD